MSLVVPRRLLRGSGWGTGLMTNKPEYNIHCKAMDMTLWYYSGTPLNGHPCTTAICYITATSSGPD